MVVECSCCYRCMLLTELGGAGMTEGGVRWKRRQIWRELHVRRDREISLLSGRPHDGHRLTAQRAFEGADWILRS